MSTRTLLCSAFAIRASRPNYVYGQPQHVPLEWDDKDMLVRAGLPPDLHEDTVVASATLVFRQGSGTWTGSYTMHAWRNTAPLRAQATWNNAPTHAATATDTLTKVDSPASSDWELDVTADVAAFVAGTKPNYGWRIGLDGAALRFVRGATYSNFQPHLVLVYAEPGGAPIDLMPDGGAVATDEPTVTFTCPDDTVAIQVQVDPAGDWVTPDFDSGEVAEVAGLLDLAATAYAPGWSGGESTQWRARYKHSDLGWGPWSVAAEFSYVPHSSLTIDTPDSTPSDPTPTVSWTFGGTQTAWRVRLLDADNRPLSNTSYRSGTDDAWTPAQGFSEDGETGTIEVLVRDDVDRIAVPGFGTWAVATLAVTVDLDGTVDPMGTLVAAQPDASPIVSLTGTRSEIPDEVVIFRNGRRIARLDGVDVFDGTDFAWDDFTAAPGTAYVYRVAPVVAGAVGAGGPTASITPEVVGWWLLDAEAEDSSARAAAVWGVEAGSWNRTDVAVVHQTLSGRFVRRRLGRPMLSGSMAGTLVDAMGLDAADQAALLESYAGLDAGHVFRLVAGAYNIAVNIGDVLVYPTPLSGAERVDAASVSFWEVEG